MQPLSSYRIIEYFESLNRKLKIVRNNNCGENWQTPKFQSSTLRSKLVETRRITIFSPPHVCSFTRFNTVWTFCEWFAALLEILTFPFLNHNVHTRETNKTSKNLSNIKCMYIYIYIEGVYTAKRSEQSRNTRKIDRRKNKKTFLYTTYIRHDPRLYAHGRAI